MNVLNIYRAALEISTKVAFCPDSGFSKSSDDKTFWEEFPDPLKLADGIHKKVIAGKFVFAPFQKKVKRRLDGRLRVLYIPTWRDRIIDRWLSHELNEIWQSRFSSRSFAFRADIGIDSCCNDIRRAVAGSTFFLKRDVSQYYYSIDKDILWSKLSAVGMDPIIARLIKERIFFSYREGDEIKKSDLGIAFGSSLSCVLANVYLNDFDHLMEKLPVTYFRYADDFLICSKDANSIHSAEKTFDEEMVKLKLAYKKSHTQNLSFVDHESFQKIETISHLGLLFSKRGVRLTKEKFRKVLRLFKREYRFNRTRIQKNKNVENRLKEMIGVMNAVVTDRVRGVGVIDYYLKHIDDVGQLKQLDRCVTELVISKVLRRRFCNGLFRKIPYSKIRSVGLISLVHRSRLLQHGKIKTKFRSLLNEKRIQRYERTITRKLERYDQLKLKRKIGRMG